MGLACRVRFRSVGFIQISHHNIHQTLGHLDRAELECIKTVLFFVLDCQWVFSPSLRFCVSIMIVPRRQP